MRRNLSQVNNHPTQIYLDADLALKEAVLAKTKPIESKAGRYRPDDDLLTFLNGL